MIRTTILLAGLAFVVGCAGNSKPTEPTPQAPRTMTIERLAERLGLEVRSQTMEGATLENRANTVTIFTNPEGRVFVNGRPIGEVGGITERRGVVSLDASLEEAIRGALRPEPPALDQSPPTTVIRSGPTPTRRGRRPASTWVGRIVIDPGHGGKDPGAIASNELHEKNVVLDVARRVATRLRSSGIDVSMTRDGDRFIELDDRVSFGNARRPLLFVSIHADAAESRSAHGFTLYVARKASRESLRAAELIRRELARAGGTDRGIKRADYRVLKNARGPAVLVELGFLSNRREASRLGTRGYRDRLGAAVSRGVAAFALGK